jgi:hypothetical protein
MYVNDQRHTNPIDRPLRELLVRIAGNKVEICRNFSSKYPELITSESRLLEIFNDCMASSP